MHETLKKLHVVVLVSKSVFFFLGNCWHLGREKPENLFFWLMWIKDTKSQNALASLL